MYVVMSSEPDASLLTRSIDEPDCFALLFDRHFARVYRYLRRRLGDELARSWRRRRSCRRSARGRVSPRARGGRCSPGCTGSRAISCG